MTHPIIHQTDLFHPHGDPDDHFDLAAVFALAAQGRLDLRGIVIDYPPPEPFNLWKDQEPLDAFCHHWETFARRYRGIGFALWNFRGAFGVLDSGRADGVYEDWHGHKLDRKLLDLLKHESDGER